jgi:hypothetical protein
MAARTAARTGQRKDVIGMDNRVGGHGAKVSMFTAQNEGVRVCRVRSRPGVKARRSLVFWRGGDSPESNANGLIISRLRIWAIWGTIVRKASRKLLVSWDCG